MTINNKTSSRTDDYVRAFINHSPNLNESKKVEHQVSKVMNETFARLNKIFNI